MGNKRITEKYFWQCTNGAVPAQLQGTNTTTKKISEEKYITIQDKATSSWIDFGCTKLMLIYALLAAAAIVVGAMIIGTGGAALIAIGAIAGLAGAAWGAVVGTMLCGHMGVKIRDWIPVPKAKQTLIQGQEQITGDYKMTCMIPGGIVTFAPQIKNWSQAISLGASNYLGKLMEGMMAGAAVGMGGALISGGAAAFTSGGIRGIGQAALQFAKSMPKNFVVNAVESVGKFGLAMRGVMGVQNTAATYGNTGSASLSDFKDGVISMETGAIDSAKLIYSDMTGGVILNEKGEPKHAGWQDYLGMVMMFAPVGQGKRDLENGLKNEPEGKGSKADDAEGKKADEEDGAPKAEVQDGDAPKQEGEAEAYEATKAKLSQINGDPPFERNPKHSEAEFKKQIEGQENGLNKLTVDEFIKNRDEYIKNGRSKEGSKAQKKFREKVEKEKIKEYRKEGLSPEDAKVKAKEYMSDKAALHDPDQIAGGHGENVTGMGDKGVNSSLGSQWKDRIGAIDKAVREQAAGMTPEQMQNTHLNIKLPWN